MLFSYTENFPKCGPLDKYWVVLKFANLRQSALTSWQMVAFIFQLHKRIESLQQQNRVLKCELETYKLRVKSLQEENRSLRQASVHIQAKAEQEEEFISNTLLKKIQALKKEKENLALNYEQEEECLTNDLSRKLNQVIN